MTRERFIPRPVSEAPVACFADAEEAWFWYVRCQRARIEGASFREPSTALQRPCDPDDIYRAAVGLRRRGILGGRHLETLACYGLADRPPDSRRNDEAHAARLWSEALDRLATVLRAKGIVL